MTSTTLQVRDPPRGVADRAVGNDLFHPPRRLPPRGRPREHQNTNRSVDGSYPANGATLRRRADEHMGTPVETTANHLHSIRTCWLPH